MTALREHLADSITAVEAEIARLAPLLHATVTPIYRRGHSGKWCATVRLQRDDHVIALSPQFDAWDDAVSFRLAVLDALDRAT